MFHNHSKHTRTLIVITETHNTQKNIHTRNPEKNRKTYKPETHTNQKNIQTRNPYKPEKHTNQKPIQTRKTYKPETHTNQKNIQTRKKYKPEKNMQPLENTYIATEQHTNNIDNLNHLYEFVLPICSYIEGHGTDNISGVLKFNIMKKHIAFSRRLC